MSEAKGSWGKPVLCRRDAVEVGQPVLATLPIDLIGWSICDPVSAPCVSFFWLLDNAIVPTVLKLPSKDPGQTPGTPCLWITGPSSQVVINMKLHKKA